ncbi:MAG: CvpA family protein [Geminicoccaceae bacterium]|nr:MAG: CvpA family protein [Geminicoccaceae bacterium]
MANDDGDEHGGEVMEAIDQFRLAGFTVLDLFAVVVILISTLLALFRGMTREAFTLGSWLGAAVVAYMAWPQVAPFLEPYLADATIRMVAAIALAFVVALVLFLVIATMLANVIENSFLAPVDRALGIVFGFARGAVLVLVTYVVLLFVFPSTDRPSWIMDAQLRPLLDEGIRMAREWGPELPTAEPPAPELDL